MRLGATVLAGVMAAAVSMPALATDWSGAYVGVYGAFNNTDTDFVDNGYNTFTLVPMSADSSENFGAGVTLGFNDQTFDWLVLGLEAELGWIDMDGFRVQPGAPGGDTSVRTEGGFYGLVAARAGLTPWDGWMFYAKAGLAIADFGARVSDTCSLAPCGPATVAGEPGNSEEGIAFGGGLEFLVHSNWSVKAEYLRMEFEDSTIPLFRTNAPVGFIAPNFSYEGEVDSVKIGLNYHF